MTVVLMRLWIMGGAILALALVPGTLELLVLTLAGIFRPRKPTSNVSSGPYALTVVIPAYNEELLLARCIASIMAADREGIDLRVAVIADNCTDRTAEVAHAAGAMVLERFDAERRGKGHTLNFAFQALAPSSTGAFAVVDADSEIAANFLIETVTALRSGADATQCRYLFRNTPGTLRGRLLGLTSAAYNILRARGRATLGFSAGIYGNGFALTAKTVSRVPYSAQSLAEDVEYHLALLNSGLTVRFVDQTSVYADIPVSVVGAESQQARWDGGRLRLTCVNLPKVLAGLMKGKAQLAEACLDLLLLPLVFHAILLVFVCLTPSVFIRCFGLAGLSITVIHLVVAAFVAGNGVKDLTAVAAIPAYVLWKVLSIRRLVTTVRRTAEWVRTERALEVKQ